MIPLINLINIIIAIKIYVILYVKIFYEKELSQIFIIISTMSIQRCLNGLNSKLAVVLGAQWGDEGKGKLVSVLSDRYDVSARFNGGANAGHTVIRNGKKYAFHLVPSAIVSPKIQTLLGNGVVVNLDGMF